MTRYFLIFGAIFYFSSCKKVENENAPKTFIADEVETYCYVPTNDSLNDRQTKYNKKDLEKSIQTNIKQNKLARTPGTLYVSIALHIVLPNPNLITDDQVSRQIDILNADFKRNNSELNSSGVYLGGYNYNDVANCNIEFAVTDIIRKVTDIAFFYPYGDPVMQSIFGGSNAIEPQRKLNIWVCNLSALDETKNRVIEGYSYNPYERPPELDGVVLDYQAFGTNPVGYRLFKDSQFGRTATHEIGHWLNLKHPWGDTPCGSDFVDDTNTQEGPSFNCPSKKLRSKCDGKPVQWMNYMDYSNDECRYMFTKGQKDRMDGAIDGPRISYFNSTTSVVEDIDGNIYTTVNIGTQVWLVQNLKTTKYRNGNTIPNVSDAAEWSGLTTGAYCNYENDQNNSTIYGRLYNWYAVNDSRNIAPVGWHVPSDAEWTILENFLGGVSIAGGKMKETGTSHWLDPNTSATNSSGFAGLPGGTRGIFGNFASINTNGNWWTSSIWPGFGIYYRGLQYSSEGITVWYHFERSGMSVRCIKD